MWRPDRAEARRRAFAELPHGPRILARIERQLAGPRRPIAAGEAVALLREGLRMVGAGGVDAPDPDVEISLLTEAELPLLDAFAEADSPFYGLLDRAAARAFAESGEIGKAAFFFLREPLYRLADDTTVATWACWPLCSASDAPDPLEPAYRLWRGGWSPGWGKGVFLFDRRREFGLM